jgi:hypothetical protein
LIPGGDEVAVPDPDPVRLTVSVSGISLTVIAIVSESDRFGVPASVTTTSNVYTPGPWASEGVHVNTPDVDPIAAPPGTEPSRLNVNVCAGTSESVADAVKVMRLNSGPDLFPIAARTGALLASLTVIVIVSRSSSVPGPLSLTTTSKVYTPGPWLSEGVHVNTPDVDPIAAPPGTDPSRLNVNVCAGKSVSVADAVKVTRLASGVVMFAMGASTGGTFTSLTVIEMVSRSSRLGVPLSVTTTSKV